MLPFDPVTRAKFRLALFRIENDWYKLAEQIEEAAEKKQATRARKILKESVLASADVFAAKEFFLGDEFSLVDASVAPLLWRLSSYNIDFGKGGEAIDAYMERMFARPSFRASLTELEQEMRL
ncbi:MAG: glutathione binding-like protein [Pseudomonadota bacterium]